MKILLTGANGYVGKRLLPELLQLNHEVICCVRDKNRLGLDAATLSKISIWEIDFLEEPNFDAIPKDIDVAFYLIHSMTASTTEFDVLEANSALHFNSYMNEIGVKQVVYLSGIINDSNLSKRCRRYFIQRQLSINRFTRRNNCRFWKFLF
jgi:uncharacterized protein YbjT (DUF2867 family)